MQLFQPLIVVLLLFFGIFAAPLAAADQPPIVFKIQFEWGATGPGGESFKGDSIGKYSPSSQWQGRFGANMKLVSGKGYDETTPINFYKDLGGVGAMRQNDVLQFYKAVFSSTVKTGNGCTVVDNNADETSSNAASLNREENGARLTFYALEAIGENCDQYSYVFSAEFGFTTEQQESLEQFLIFTLSNNDMKNFKSIQKINNFSAETDPSYRWKVWGKATLTAE
jgi:hypothetical protein